jgi:hypothetical protein
VNIEEDFQAKVVADSISPYGIRLTTLQLRYPRFIHAEFMTHRVFSRNARSSRAVPVSKLLKEAPYIPHFMANQKGMQSFEEMEPNLKEMAENLWLRIAEECKDAAATLGGQLEVHKQWANRMLEWFGYIDVVVSSTRWANFFELRDHEMAMPEIQHLARAMRDAMQDSEPVERSNTWHLPYVTDEERNLFPEEDLNAISTARCARVSYAPFDNDGKIDYDADIYLARRLIQAEPLHASPAEHQAYPDMLLRHGMPLDATYEWACPKRHGNFFGWIQHRKLYANEVAGIDSNHTVKECLDYYERNNRVQA